MKWVESMGGRKKQNVDDPIYRIYPDFPVLILENYEWSEAEVCDSMHFHYYLEIGRCNKGEGYIVTEQSENAYQAGDITMISPNLLHATRNRGDSVTSWSYLFIDVEDLLNIFRFPAGRNRERLMEVCHNGVQVIDEKNTARISRILTEINSLNTVREGMYKMQIVTCLLQILMEISNMMCRDIVPSERDGEALQIYPAVDYIYAHYMEQIKIGDLAELCHFSQSHFRKVFQKCKGLSPLDYLNCIRIREAARMLLQTSLSIRVISELCGYQAVSSFERNFAKRMGKLPGKWREDQRKSGIKYL